ncbi:MAG: hypothetical protein WDM76_16460 [Limisphaerales bacterium]
MTSAPLVVERLTLYEIAPGTTFQDNFTLLPARAATTLVGVAGNDPSA